MNKSDKLKSLNEIMSQCNKCKLRCGALRVVFGAGNPEAEILFIGEAPGKKEDELGIPFVGSSGRILDKILESIKMNREEIYPHTKITDGKANSKKNIHGNNKKDFGVGVYITNICKCRPPENRDPLPEEIKECLPWLEKQIEIIDPKIIVTLGKYALNCFTPDAKISEVHGEIMKIGNLRLFPLHHPAAARINKKTRALFEEDFKKIPAIIKKIKKEQ